MAIRLGHGADNERLEIVEPETYPPDVKRPTGWARLDSFDKLAEESAPPEPLQVCSRCGNVPELHGEPSKEGRDHCGCPATPEYILYPEKFPNRPQVRAMIHPSTQRPLPRPKPPKDVPG
jgi:hypothetical protein